MRGCTRVKSEEKREKRRPGGFAVVKPLPSSLFTLLYYLLPALKH
jgi:hypothetical protein